MKVVKASYEIMDPIDQDYIYKKIEKIARTCYDSLDKIGEGSAERMIKHLVKNHHEAMLEHVSITVKFICDRAIANEIVRHRVASYAQASTRYINYKDGVEFIDPCFFSEDEDHDQARVEWMSAMSTCESAYQNMIESGSTPQEARDVLPLSTKTVIYMTANLREWRHVLQLRALGTTGRPHPQIVEIMMPLFKELKEKLPAVFVDMEVPD